MNIFLARQPILDRRNRTIGYEILYRSGTGNAFPEVEGSQATLMMLQNLFCNMGLAEVAGSKKVFINVTRDLILSDLSFLRPDNVVIEVLESVKIDDELVKQLERLKSKGFKLALDDFEDTPETDPALPVVDIVKVDWRAHDQERIARICDRLAAYDLQLLAEKIETSEEKDAAQRMGFSYFQGYYFARPKLMKGKSMPVSQISRLKLLSHLYHEDLDLDRIYEVVSRDAGLTVKLLKLINSAAIGLSVKITSLQQAVSMLGEQHLKRWLSIILLYDVSQASVPETFLVAVTRAFFMEGVLKAKGLKRFMAPGFLAGLLSMTTALTGIALKRFLKELPVHPVIQNALMANKGPLAPFLLLCKAYEQGAIGVAQRLAERLSMPLGVISECYLNAAKEATAMDAMVD